MDAPTEHGLERRNDCAKATVSLLSGIYSGSDPFRYGETREGVYCRIKKDTPGASQADCLFLISEIKQAQLEWRSEQERNNPALIITGKEFICLQRLL